MPRLEDDEEYWDDDEAESPDDDEEEIEEDLVELIDEATELVETGEARKAVRLWRRSIERFADEPEALFQFARACHQVLEDDLGDEEAVPADSELLPFLELGLSQAEEATTQDPEHAGAWALMGRFFFLGGRFSGAVEAFEKALEADAGQPEVQRLLDIARERAGG